MLVIYAELRGKFVIVSRLGIYFVNGAFRFACNVCAALTSSMTGYVSNPFEPLTFLLQPKKVSKTGRSPNYVLHPIIWQI
jgi:hypothetical protein